MRNRLHVEGQVQGRTGSDAQPHHGIGVGVGVGVGVGTGIAPSAGGGGAKTSNFDLNASSPNLNLGAAAAAAALSANALQQHVNGGGQHTLPKVSSSQLRVHSSIPTLNYDSFSSTLPITLARRCRAMPMAAVPGR